MGEDRQIEHARRRRIRTIMLALTVIVTGLIVSQNISHVHAASGIDQPHVAYNYSRISLDEASAYFTAASFTIAGGLSLYTLSYLPERRSYRRQARRQISFARYHDYAKTTY